MLKGLFFIIFSLTTVAVLGANRFSRPDGTWSATNGGANCGCTPTQNDDIFVNHNITLAGPFTVNTGSLTVNSPATLTISGNLTFNNNSTVIINLGGSLQVNGNFENKNNSDEITFNGNIAITGNFTNGTGGSGSAIIDFGPNATISIGGTCSNAGQVNDSSGSYSGCGQGVLPITLLFFKAIQSGEKATLSWATASEKNFDYFSIERSANGMDFSEIEQIKGNGTTYERMDYGIDDNYPLIGRNYYRLKSVDFDGYTEYFNVVLVNFSGEKTFSVFPNPSNGTAVNFALNFVPEGNTTITIFDNYNSNIAIVKPTDHWQSVTFANSLNSGLYFARIVSKDFVRVERFVVK